MTLVNYFISLIVIGIALYIGQYTIPRHSGPYYGIQRRTNSDPNIYFFNQHKLLIYHHEWYISKNQKPQGAIFISHGFGEHCGRYDHVAARFNAEGFNVYCMEHQGFGRSEGDRAFVEMFQHYVDDFLQYVNLIKEKEYSNSKVPFFLLGHSLGGLIGATAVQQSSSLWTTVLFSGPFFKNSPDLIDENTLLLISYLGTFFPKIPFFPEDNTHWIISDTKGVEKYRSDPLIYKGSIPIRFGSTSFQRLKEFEEEMENFPLPFFIGHGGEDHLCHVSGSELLFNKSKVEDKEFKVYEGLYHEIFQEDSHQSILDDYVNWINRFI